MEYGHQHQTTIYTPALIELATCGVRLASLLEQGAERRQYVRQAIELLPRIYSLTLTLPDYLYDPELDYIEEYISEASYDLVRTKAEEILGEEDLYLTTLSSDMQYSDTPLARHISEMLADIYQHVGNLLGILRAQNDAALPAAIGRYQLYWREHWGLALISAMGALHQIYTTMIIDGAFEADEPLADEEDSLITMN